MRDPNTGRLTDTPTFLQELTTLINRHSLENLSNTPDYVLAAYLNNCLTDYAHAVRSRDRHFGIDHSTPKVVNVASTESEN